MGCLRLLGSLRLQVSLENIGLFCRALLQKRPIILRSLLVVATPYVNLSTKSCLLVTKELPRPYSSKYLNPTYIYIYTYIYIDMYIYTHIYIYIHVYVYTHTPCRSAECYHNSRLVHATNAARQAFVT